MGKRNLLLAFHMVFIASAVLGDSLPLLRISTENTESHIQTETLLSFVEKLRERTRGRLNIEYYHSAQLFRDQEVIRALAMNKIEMAVPGTWIISDQIPEMNYFLFPAFFGESKSKTYSFLKSPAGRKLLQLTEYKLDCVIPGDFLDLGHAHIFTTEKQIARFSDIENLTIRVAGGILNKERVEALGAKGVIISWPDLPHSLETGVVDGILTTFETVKSAELWEYGIRYAFMDYEYFPQYIPLISRTFWDDLSTELQEDIVYVWNEVAMEHQIKAEKAQKEARSEAEDQGIAITEPGREELMRIRSLLRESSE